MHVPRFFHTATALADGRVLVTGGADDADGPALRSAEVFDAVTSRWTVTGAMSVPRIGHSATRLHDGRVLIAGGSAAMTGNPTAAADIFDPRTMQFTRVAPMQVARRGHAAALLPDGRVLVVGGETSAGTATARAEVYDPATNTWKPVAPLPRALTDLSATTLADGTVLVAGGAPCALDLVFADCSGHLHASAAAYLFVAATGRWLATAPMPYAAAEQTATAIGDGVLVTGGTVVQHDRPCPTDRVAFYSAHARTWTTLPPMTTTRTFHTATALGDGTVVIAGGYRDVGRCAVEPIASAETRVVVMTATL